MWKIIFVQDNAPAYVSRKKNSKMTHQWSDSLLHLTKILVVPY